jgi:hypothetical protein
MAKPRALGELVSTGSIFADGTLVVSDISGLTASAAELNIMDGVTVSAAEINCVDGVTAPIQTQLGAFLSATLDGPAPGVIYATVPITLTITNYDILTTYTLSTTNGTVTRSGETITYTPSALGAGGFVINGRSISGYTVEALAIGQQAYTTAGTYSWVAPAGVGSVSVVAVGGGGGRSGGGLGYRNNISVVSGNSYTVLVGAGANGADSTESYFISTATVRGGATTASGFTGGTFTGDGGGAGGSGTFSGGGAGGYAGAGGNTNAAAQANSGGGGGGGFDGGGNNGFGGGGVGLLGIGATGGVNQGGSGGTAGNLTSGVRGGLYGGGGSFGTNFSSGSGANGAVRIIWPGATRSFPSTNTGDL